MSQSAVAYQGNPFLEGNFGPVTEEHDERNMEVRGRVPDDLVGNFLRVGPNPAYVFDVEKYHTFDGDGMIHAMEFGNGTARYGNRFVLIEGYKLEQERGDWVWKGMNSMMDPSSSRVPEGAPGIKNLDSGAVEEGLLCDVHCDFTRINKAYTGSRNRYVYGAIFHPTRPLTFDDVVKYDNDTGSSESFEYGAHRHGGEAVFAPRVAAQAEDDGYLLVFIHDENTDQSECLIIDAQDIAAGPVATIIVPHRVPYGFHAGWVVA